MYIVIFSVLVDVFKTSSSIKGNLDPHDPRKWCMVYKQIETFTDFNNIYPCKSHAYKASYCKFGGPKPSSCLDLLKKPGLLKRYVKTRKLIERNCADISAHLLLMDTSPRTMRIAFSHVSKSKYTSISNSCSLTLLKIIFTLTLIIICQHMGQKELEDFYQKSFLCIF